MLAYKLGAVRDKFVGAFSLGGFVVPGAGEGDFHRYVGNNRFHSEIEGGISGDNFGIGERAYVTDLGVLGGNVAVFVAVELFELHTCGDTRKISAFIDGSERVVEVRKTLGVSHGAGGVAEFDCGEFFRGFEHIGLVAERVGEYNVAACVYEFARFIVALFALGYVKSVLDLSVGKPHSGNCFVSGVYEVFVIGAVGVVKEDKTDFEIRGNGHRGVGRKQRLQALLRQVSAQELWCVSCCYLHKVFFICYAIRALPCIFVRGNKAKMPYAVKGYGISLL